jgi:uncharacterized protein YndB with AHSA1/START domain
MENISQGFFIKSTREKIFEAISTPEGFDNWWTLKCSGTAQLEDEFNFYFSEIYNWKARITKLVPNESIEFTMTVTSEGWENTTFGFQLNDDSNGNIYIEFYHKNWKIANKEFQITNYCWANLFFQLKEYIETGIVLEFSKRNKHIELC